MTVNTLTEGKDTDKMLENTIKLMLSNEWEDRLVAEYTQADIRLKRLIKHLSRGATIERYEQLLEFLPTLVAYRNACKKSLEINNMQSKNAPVIEENRKVEFNINYYGKIASLVIDALLEQYAKQEGVELEIVDVRIEYGVRNPNERWIVSFKLEDPDTTARVEMIEWISEGTREDRVKDIVGIMWNNAYIRCLEEIEHRKSGKCVPVLG